MRAISWERWILPLLAALTFTAFCQVGEHGFVNYDDDRCVFLNQHLAEGLSIRGISWAFTSLHCSNWHPLTWLSYLLDYELHGFSPGGFHLTNLVLHVAATLLLFVALRRLTGAVWRSALVAALFAWHPLHVESVAWVAERKDVLSGVFWMLVLWTYAHYAEQPSVRRYLLVAACLALGLLAKPMLVTLPFVLLLLDYWPLGRCLDPRGPGRLALHRLPSLALEKLPLLALATASSWITLKAQQPALIYAEQLPIAWRAGNALVAYATYIAKTLWPAGLAAYYPHPGYSLSFALVAGAGALLIAISAAALALRTRAPYLLVGWLWYVGTLVPVIGLVQVGTQGLADRYTYLPLVGLFMGGVWGAAALASRWRIDVRWTAAVAVSLLAALFCATWLQVAHWRDTLTLFGHALRVTERNPVAHFNLAVAYKNRGQFEEAIGHFEKTLEINPLAYHVHGRLASLLAQQGEEERAARHNAAAVWLLCQLTHGPAESPGDDPRDPTNPAEALARGRGLALRGDMDAARLLFEQALRMDPASMDARLALGTALFAQHREEEAARTFEEVLELRPDDPAAHYKLGVVRLRQERWQEARKHLGAAAVTHPRHREIRSLLRTVESEREL